MPVAYLLDTNTASYIIKGHPARVREKLLRVPMSEVGVSAVTEAELRFGAARRRDVPALSAAIEEFLLRVETLPWDSAAAQNYAIVRASVEERGLPVGNLDLMIAAHAMACGAILVSSDRVFQRLKGLRLEDWTKA
jgi:tRNA(fMet)-specific endonuclease VapC